jgi:cellulose synthase/poly-beta-1,6-N-acetylglucosamine synthase-like glycosyltransferase
MFENVVNVLMYPFLFLSLYFQVFLVLSFVEKRRKIKKEEYREPTIFPSVTIAVPCWNEEKTLGATLDSLLSLDYPKDKVKIVIVDDGSKDGTGEIANKYAEKYEKSISVLTKENGGKHTAMNLALKECETELFGCLDADSFVEPNTLKEIVSYFEADQKVMAVTPCIHIKNPKTLVQRMQAVEYLLGVFVRKVYGELDAIQVTPGPFSIFKKEVFDIIGPYKKAHNTEDFEITLRMHLHHLKIANAHKATVYTYGPETARGFIRQHVRWVRGFIENTLDYRHMFFKSKYGNFGIITLPVAFIFVFYEVYVFTYLLYRFIIDVYKKYEKISTVGFTWSAPNFDLFYMSGTTLSFVGMVMITLFIFVIIVARELTSDKQDFYKNFPIFFFLFPIFAGIYATRSVFDTIFKRRNDWVLQDNKGAFQVAKVHES